MNLGVFSLFEGNLASPEWDSDLTLDSHVLKGLLSLGVSINPWAGIQANVLSRLFLKKEGKE